MLASPVSRLHSFDLERNLVASLIECCFNFFSQVGLQVAKMAQTEDAARAQMSPVSNDESIGEDEGSEQMQVNFCSAEFCDRCFFMD